MKNDIEKIKFKNLDIDDAFFDSFKKDYSNFIDWYERKKDCDVYCYREKNKLKGLLVLKKESKKEDYSDILPLMNINDKLKISTFKVVSSNKKIREEFIKIIFEQANKLKVSEIYFTIFDNDKEKRKLINLFINLRFEYYGKKDDELVYIKYVKKRGSAV